MLHASWSVWKNSHVLLIQSSTDLQIWMPPYTQTYWHERIITHCTAGYRRNLITRPDALGRLEVDDTVSDHESRKLGFLVF